MLVTARHSTPATSSAAQGNCVRCSQLSLSGSTELHYCSLLVCNLQAFGGRVAASLVAADIQGNEAGSALLVVDTAQIRLQQASVINGNAAVAGAAAAAWDNAAVVITGGTELTKNEAKVHGGGLYMVGSSRLNATSALLSQNTAANIGGAIYFNQQPSAVMTDVKLTGNHAGVYGGAFEVGEQGKWWAQTALDADAAALHPQRPCSPALKRTSPAFNFCAVRGSLFALSLLLLSLPLLAPPCSKGPVAVCFFSCPAHRYAALRLCM